MIKKLPKAFRDKAYFPKNIRSIPEHRFSRANSQHLKVAVISCFSLFLIGLIFLQGVTLHYNLQYRDDLKQERLQIENEISYWEGIANKYQDYRDVYYRIASLQYKVGNLKASQEYLQKALDLDPNFPEGHVLGAKIGIENY